MLIQLKPATQPLHVASKHECAYIHVHVYTCTYIYMHMYMCTCTCGECYTELHAHTCRKCFLYHCRTISWSYYTSQLLLGRGCHNTYKYIVRTVKCSDYPCTRMTKGFTEYITNTHMYTPAGIVRQLLCLLAALLLLLL